MVFDKTGSLVFYRTGSGFWIRIRFFFLGFGSVWIRIQMVFSKVWIRSGFWILWLFSKDSDVSLFLIQISISCSSVHIILNEKTVRSVVTRYTDTDKLLPVN